MCEEKKVVPRSRSMLVPHQSKRTCGSSGHHNHDDQRRRWEHLYEDFAHHELPCSSVLLK